MVFGFHTLTVLEVRSRSKGNLNNLQHFLKHRRIRPGFLPLHNQKKKQKRWMFCPARRPACCWTLAPRGDQRRETFQFAAAGRSLRDRGSGEVFGRWVAIPSPKDPHRQCLVCRSAASPLRFRSPPCLHQRQSSSTCPPKIPPAERKREQLRRFCRGLHNDHIWSRHEGPGKSC